MKTFAWICLLIFSCTINYALELEKNDKFIVSRGDVLIQEDENDFYAYFLFNKDNIYATDMLNGIVSLNYEGKALSHLKIPFITLPTTMQSIGDTSILLYSPSERKGGVWTYSEIQPSLRFALNYEFSYTGIISNDLFNEMYGFVHFYHTEPRPNICGLRFSLDLNNNHENFTVEAQYILPDSLLQGIDTETNYGSICANGDVIVLLRDSRVVKFNREAEILDITQRIDGFKFWGKYEENKGVVEYEKYDRFQFNKSLPILEERFLVAPCQMHIGEKKLFVWDLFTFKYLGNIEYENSSEFLGANEEKLFFGKLSDENIEITEYNLKVDSIGDNPLETIMIINPITEKRMPIQQLIGPIENKMMIYFTSPGDCAYMMFTNLSKPEHKPDYMKNPFKVVYSHRDRDVLISYKNSTALFVDDPIYNWNYKATEAMPFAVLLDENFNIIEDYTKDEIGNAIWENKKCDTK